MIIELRTYTTQPGRREDWVGFMRDVIVPLNESMGLTVLGLFTDDGDDDTFVWMRRFTDHDELTRLTHTLYTSEAWRLEIAPRLPEFLVKGAARISLLRPTPSQPPAEEASPEGTS